jgi:hypothetical protein
MSREFAVATVEEFAAVHEPGADALIGTKNDAFIPEGGDVMAYGNGGAGKTTLINDVGFHLAAGAPTWLGIRVARSVRVLMIENEGPRPLFRAKLRRKLAAWSGPPLEGRLGIFEKPWGSFTFADDEWREALAARVRDDEIDVLIVGPVTRSGMDEAGTLQEVNAFMALVAEVREKAGRILTVVLVHHENKGGTVSGAWEGSGDTLLHVEARGPGKTHVHVQKARWSSEHHGAHLELGWADGEGFTVEDARDYAEEIARLLADGKWRTAEEIAATKKGGIGAGKDTVKDVLAERPDTFIERKGGKDIGRHPNATVYGLASAQKPDELDTGSTGSAGRLASTTLHPVGVGSQARQDPPQQLGLASDAEQDTPESAVDDEDSDRATAELERLGGGAA